jgi:hypothetical protein
MRTSLTIRPEVWRALRRLAELKAEQQGGRPNASAIIEKLVLEETARQTRARVARA